MSKLAVKGHASGTGTVTLEAPNTSTNRTITLPDEDVTLTSTPEGTAVKSTGEAGGTKFLREDGDGTCSWQDVSGNTPAFMAERTSSNQSLSDASTQKCEFNTQTFSTGGTYDSATNYRWTPGTAGKYYISVSALVQGGENKWRSGEVYLYKNGASYAKLAKVNTLSSNADTFSLNGSIIDTANNTDYYELYVYIDVTSGTPYLLTNSYFKGFLIGGA